MFTRRSTMRVWQLIAFGSIFAAELSGAIAGARVERVTLMLDGETCVASQAAVEAALRALDGVQAVDLRTVPGHVLVDVDAALLTPDQVASAVHKQLMDQRCTPVVMKSCISAQSAQYEATMMRRAN
ncbi:MAG TPA: heavy-metal-associated domain-containing protein [Nitrospiraceae bacterium]|nr:heavy-metal-associated domain-containing protein [Nitrospiraceae bacterium]